MKVKLKELSTTGEKSLSIALQHSSYEQLLLAAIHHLQCANAKTNYANTL
jgi:hypothetical protein